MSRIPQRLCRAIGYKELIPYLEGTISLEQAVENLKMGTRRFSKRQLSWFRRMEGVHTLYIDDYGSFEQLTDAAMEVIEQHYAKE